MVLMSLGLLVVGCSNAMEGVVTDTAPLAVGSPAPDILFKTPDGKDTSLTRVRLPVTLVAFVAPSGDCSRLAPEVVGLARQFQTLPVTVVQVSQPNSQCPQGPGCLQVSGPGKRDVLALCDAQKTAFKAYLEPAIGTLFLIDANGKIVGISRLSQADSVQDLAMRLGKEAAAVHRGDGAGEH
jgi:hypothetical protein